MTEKPKPNPKLVPKKILLYLGTVVSMAPPLDICHVDCGHGVQVVCLLCNKPEQTLINGPKRLRMSSSYSIHACKLATWERGDHGLDCLN